MKRYRSGKAGAQDGLSTSFLTLLRLASWVGFLPISVRSSSQRITFNSSRRMKWFNGLVIALLSGGRAYSFYDDIVTGTVPDSMVTVTLRLSELVAMAVYFVCLQLTSDRRVACLRSFVQAIKEIDACLEDNTVHDKERCRVRYLMITMSFVFPILYWDVWRQTLNAQDTLSTLSVITNYTPFFIAIIMLQCCQTTITFFYIMADIRIVTLHSIAKLVYKDAYVAKIKEGNRVKENGITRVFQEQKSVVIETIDDIVGARRVNRHIDYPADKSKQTTQGLLDKVRRVVRLQSEIRDLCTALNKCYDAVLLIFLLLSVVQLNMSPFFLIVDSSMIKAGETISLQVAWIILHTHWIAMQVEACNRIARKDRDLSSMLGDVLAELSLETGAGLREREMRALWRANELSAVAPLTFEPLDLIVVDRSLYGTIARTITTYLVILIQLYKTYS